MRKLASCGACTDLRLTERPARGFPSGRKSAHRLGPLERSLDRTDDLAARPHGYAEANGEHWRAVGQIDHCFEDVAVVLVGGIAASDDGYELS